MTHAALKFAEEVARVNNSTCDGVRYCDTHYPLHPECYRVGETLVVYEDEPDCVVSVEVTPTRFRRVS